MLEVIFKDSHGKKSDGFHPRLENEDTGVVVTCGGRHKMRCERLKLLYLFVGPFEEHTVGKVNQFTEQESSHLQ